MVTIHLKDGKEKQFESNVALSEAAKAISNSLGKEAVVAKVDGELTDLRGSSNPAFISRRKICNWPGY